jgi:hypothetical protein
LSKVDAAVLISYQLDKVPELQPRELSIHTTGPKRGQQQIFTD